MKELKIISGLFSYYSRWIPKYSEKAGQFPQTQCFSLCEEAKRFFEVLKTDLAKVSLGVIRNCIPFEVETQVPRSPEFFLKKAVVRHLCLELFTIVKSVILL